jgi:hypothetical protein
MTTLQFTDQRNTLELCFVQPSEFSEVRVLVRVASHGFSGHGETWVLREDFDTFRSSLIQLNETLHGEASLTSISPRTLTLQVKDVSFGFEFEQWQLSGAVAALLQ